MKTLYYLSFALSFPFQAIAGLAFVVAWLAEMIASFIHDQTTYRAWCVLHKRECDKMFPK
jgi:hypothetical protein